MTYTMRPFENASGDIWDHSHSIALSDAQKYGSFTSLPARRNLNYKAMDKIEAKVFEDWERSVGDNTTKICLAAGNDVFGSWDSLVQAEAKPGRLRFCAWISNFMFLVDDKVESMALEDAQRFTARLGRIFAIEDSCTPEDPDASPMEKLAVTYVKELLAFDQERALPVLHDWRYWLSNVDSKKVEDFDTIDAYIPYRIMNVGVFPFISMMRYVMELNISSEELKILEPLRDLAVASVALANDYWSWPKEAANNRHHQMRIMNGVTILMKENTVDSVEAHGMLKQLAITYEQATADMCAKILSQNNTHSRHFRKLVKCHLFFVAGNEIWSSTCPRYRIDGLGELKGFS